MKFILASGNKGKLLEMRAMLSTLGYDVISQKDAGYDLDVEETGGTFEENSFLKADAACRASGLPAIADDSGLEVEALGGEPGVYSARYAGENKTDHERNMYLMEKMEGAENRRAKFVSCITCVFPNGDKIVSRGECEGILLRREQGKNGFGYDPLFYLPELGRTMAEISPEKKNEISHRAKAIEKFGKLLKEYSENKR